MVMLFNGTIMTILSDSKGDQVFHADQIVTDRALLVDTNKLKKED